MISLRLLLIFYVLECAGQVEGGSLHVGEGDVGAHGLAQGHACRGYINDFKEA